MKQSVGKRYGSEHNPPTGEVGYRRKALNGGAQGRVPVGSIPTLQVMPSKVTSVMCNLYCHYRVLVCSVC